MYTIVKNIRSAHYILNTNREFNLFTKTAVSTFLFHALVSWECTSRVHWTQHLTDFLCGPGALCSSLQQIFLIPCLVDFTFQNPRAWQDAIGYRHLLIQLWFQWFRTILERKNNITIPEVNFWPNHYTKNDNMSSFLHDQEPQKEENTKN